MKKNFPLIWFFLLILDFPLPAQAEVEDGTPVSPAIVAQLMQWVEGQMGAKVPVMPQVIASRSQFERILSRLGSKVVGRPQAVYVAGRVYMDSEMWDPEEPTQLSLLVHELVHHAQYFTRGNWPCSNAKESMAYTLQNRWLEMHDHAPFVNAAWINRVSSCPDRGASTLLAQN